MQPFSWLRFTVALLLSAAVLFPSPTFRAQNFTTPAGGSSSLLTDLVAYWKLDETSGTRVDSVGGQDLTDNNTVGYAAGKQGNAADLEADSSESLWHADSATLSLGSDQDFTIFAWVKLEAAGVLDQFIISKTNWLSSADTEYVLKADNATYDRFAFSVGNGSTFATVLANSFGSVAANAVGNWVFVIAWHDSAENTLNIQCNNGAVDSTSWSGGTHDTAWKFSIGATQEYDYFRWDGLIDEAGLAKRVYSSEERSALFNSGAGTTHPF